MADLLIGFVLIFFGISGLHLSAAKRIQSEERTDKARRRVKRKYRRAVENKLIREALKAQSTIERKAILEILYRFAEESEKE